MSVGSGAEISLKTIVVGYNGSDGARDAIAAARILGRATDARVVVGAVLPYDPPLAPFAGFEAVIAKAAEPLLAEARAGLEGLDVKACHFAGGSPASNLQALAESEAADLIVLGSTERGTIGRVIPGSTAQRLLHGAPCPVLVLPRGFRDADHGTPRVIAVAYDGSAEAKIALGVAERLAVALGARMLVLTVQPPIAVLPGVPGYAPAIHQHMKAMLEEAAREADDRARPETRLLTGDPVEALLEICERDVDLLVMGSRGYGPFLSVLLGTVAGGVLGRAPCPVIVTPRGARDA